MKNTAVKYITLIFTVFFFFPLFGSDSIRVGIYENDPKVFVDKDGEPAGIFVDVLNEIARDNKWKIDFVYGDWIDLIHMIEKNEIDVLLDAALTEDRYENMKFNKIELLKSWLQLYTLSDKRINMESDLEGKRIGVLSGSDQEEFFSKYNAVANIELVDYLSYKDSVEGLKKNEVDGIVVSRFFYFSSLRSREIVPAPVIFKPEGLYFAFSDKIKNEMISKFDKAVSDLKNDPDSIYYQSLNKHLKVASSGVVPKWIYKVTLIVSIALIFFIIFSCFLRIEVKRKSVLAEKSSKALSRSENKYRELIELAADGILLGSPEGIITEANSCMETILGRSRDQIIGLHISEIFPEKTLKQNPLDFEALKKGKVVINEREFIKPDGEKTLIEMHTKMMPDGTYQSIYRDITMRKKIMETVSKNQKLESIGILAGGIAHDFNNLLTGVYGHIDMAQLSCGDKVKCMKHTESAMKSLDRARSLTYQLLTFSKGGAPVVRAEEIDSLVKEVSQFALSGSKCSIHFLFENNLHKVYADKNQISQVIENIVINAQQSMPGGGVVEISVRNIELTEKQHPVLKEGKFVKVSIADKGTGIDPEYIDKVFDPFFTTKQKGSGLGLSASYSIIARHGGYIDVESVLGEGSVFHIYLPVADVEPLDTGKKHNVTSSLHKGSGKVIVMDDEKVIRNILVKMLSKMGYEVTGCSEGKEVVETYHKLKNSGEKIEFMIFDLTVPGGMGGVESIKKIREFDKEIPVFVSSGYAEDPAVSSPQEFGFSASIAKPFNMKELSKLLDEYFSQ